MEALQLLLRITLVIFMVGNLFDMGLRLDLRQALRGLRDLRFVLTTLLWGFVLLPALAFGLSRWMPIAHPYATGLLLVGMAPCAPFLPPMVDRARGDLGYTAAFMLLVEVAIVLYMPLTVPWMIPGLSADPWTIARPLLLFLLLPMSAGIVLRHRLAALADRLHPWVKRITGIDTLLMLVLCVVVYGSGFLSLVGSYAIGAQLLFFSAASVLPYVFGAGLPQGQRIVLSLGMTTRSLGASFAPLFSVPDADQRALAMVALAVLMQAAFSFAAATLYARRGGANSAGAHA